MTLPFAFPEWLPWWVPLAVLVPVLLYLALFLMVPFSVFGLKGRLEMIDARLDEIQEEIRRLSLRLPEPGTAAPADGHQGRPPIPPAPPATEPPPRRAALRRPPREEDERWEEEEARDADPPPPPSRRSRPAGPAGRAEPRLDWPR